MLLWTLLAAQLTALAVAAQAANDPEPSAVITIRLGSEDVVSFRQSQRVVTDLDLRVRGIEYSVPLECAGGLRDVHFETAELPRWGQESERAEGTFIAVGILDIEGRHPYAVGPVARGPGIVVVAWQPLSSV